MSNQIQPGAQLYTAGFGTRAENVEVPHIDARAPTTSDIAFPIGKFWIDEVGLSSYQLVALVSFNGATTATWNVLGGAAAVYSVAGTANQITVTTAAGVATVSLPAAITAPGSLTTTTSLASGTTLTAGTGLTVTAGGAAITGTTGINVSGAAVTTIGTGGTGPVAIGNATGNTAVTGSLGTTTTLTAGTGITSTTGNIVASAGNISATLGSLSAATTVTATLGAITATNGNLVFGTAGNKIVGPYATSGTAGANSRGTITLGGGTATVSTSAFTANSLVHLSRQSIGASTALGELTIGANTPGVSFVVYAATLDTPATPLAADGSVVYWEIFDHS